MIAALRNIQTGRARRRVVREGARRRRRILRSRGNTTRQQFDLFQDELVIDGFAGGAGAGTGIEWAIGRSADIAVNHDAAACAMYKANHPSTKVYRTNIRRVSYRRMCGGRPVGLAWFSPDCTHHSKAKGGKPFRSRDRARRIRGLAWEMIRCAKEVRPRVFCFENVEEFRDWCPLTAAGLPDKSKRGQTFERWLAQWRNLGYTFEFREERACDKGAPTIRKRLMGVLRRDGQPIVWTAPTHGPKTSRPYRTAAECIDFSLPVPSIFLTPTEAKAWGEANGQASPKRPLAESTLRRVARGTVRYVLNNPKPFIVSNLSNNAPHPVDEPITTLLTGNHKYVATPFIAPITHQGDDKTHRADEPLRTITTAARGEFAAVSPVLVGVGGRKGQSPETPVDQPFHTITAKADTSVMAASIVSVSNSKTTGRAPNAWSAEDPLRTITTSSGFGVAAAFLAKHNGGHEATGQPLDRPIDTLVARDNKSLVTSHLVNLRGAVDDHPNTSQDVRQPAPTITAGGTHQAEIRTVLAPAGFAKQYPRARFVAAFLMKYFGTKKDGIRIDQPLHTVTTKDRYALVLVTIDGEDFAIVDIGMRMLTPRELFLCQGFPPDYKIDITVRVKKLVKTSTGRKRYKWFEKPLTKGEQVRLCGNSVSPPHAESIVRANFQPTHVYREVA